jgi:hypothetical protein
MSGKQILHFPRWPDRACHRRSGVASTAVFGIDAVLPYKYYGDSGNVQDYGFNVGKSTLAGREQN